MTENRQLSIERSRAKVARRFEPTESTPYIDHGVPLFLGQLAVCAWFFCHSLVPENKGKTLEQIEALWRSGKAPREL